MPRLILLFALAATLFIAVAQASAAEEFEAGNAHSATTYDCYDNYNSIVATLKELDEQSGSVAFLGRTHKTTLEHKGMSLNWEWEDPDYYQIHMMADGTATYYEWEDVGDLALPSMLMRCKKRLNGE